MLRWDRALLVVTFVAFWGTRCINAQQDCNAAIDLVFVVDVSGSICDRDISGDLRDSNNRIVCSNWNSVKGFLQAAIERLPIDEDEDLARVGMVIFGNSGEIVFDLDEYTDKSDMLDAVDELHYKGGNTNTYAGLQQAVTLLSPNGTWGARPDVNDVVIVVTDGVSTRNTELTVPESNKLKDDGGLVYVVGVTEQVDFNELEAISSGGPNSNTQNIYWFYETSFQLLTQTILDPLITAACPVTTPGPQPSDCDNRMDVVFVIDSSGSIGSRNFEFVQEFMGEVFEKLGVGGSNPTTRAGLLQFSTDTTLVFHMDDLSSKQDMVDAARNIQYLRGTTNTAEALEYVRENMFNGRNGDRSDVDDLIILMTDGGSNDHEATVEEAIRTKTDNIHIVTLGMGNWNDEYELRSIPSHPHSQNLLELQFDQLDDSVNNIRDMACNNIDECRDDPCQNRGTCIDGINDYYCECREGFGGKNCQYECENPADVVFAIDASGSITKDNFHLMVEFTKNMVQDLPIDEETRIGLETYDDGTTVYLNLDDYSTRRNIMDAITLPYFVGGTTNTAGALRVMREDMFTTDNGDRDDEDYPNVGVVLTDGRSNDPDATWREARDNRADDITMMAVGVGPDNPTRISELNGIASFPTSQTVFNIGDFRQLDSIRERLRESICNDVDECDDRPCRNGGECFDHVNGYHCECDDEYTGLNCERRCNGEIDLVLLIDKSGSIRSERFDAVKNFLAFLIDQLEIWNDKVRVGAASFHDDAQVEFYLNTYDNKQDVIQSILNIQYGGGRTNIASGLEVVQNEILTTSRGDRTPNVPNVVLMFTDGNANIREDETIPQAIDLRISGAHVIVMGVGSDLNFMEYRGIASRPQDRNIIFVDSFNDLQDIEDDVVLSFCDSVNECDSDPCENGGTCVDGLDLYICECRSGRTGERCERECNPSHDITLILDFSGSVEEVNSLELTFAERFVQGLDFSFDRSRLALITFSDDAQLHFNLDTYNSKLDVLNAMAFRLTGGRTNTQAALRLALDEVYGEDGDRRSVDNKVILVTDGGSNVSPQQTRPRADDLKDDEDVEIFVVAVGNQVDMSEISDIASGSSEPYIIRVYDQTDALQTADKLLDELCE